MKILTFLLTLAVALAPAVLRAGVIITPAAGYSITWDGNDGDFFDAAAPPGGAIVPNNLALASNGGTAIGSSELGLATHFVTNLNDGFYGNTNSWISANIGPSPGGDPGPPNTFGGVLLPTAAGITSIAWGRDNGNGDFDDDPAGTDACGGQCDDRWMGLFTLQVTGDGGTSWTDIGTLNYDGAGNDAVPGGAFTGHFRHEYDVSLAGGLPIPGNGVRLLVPVAGIGGGTALDEIEIYGTPIPEPAGAALVLLGLALPLLRRRRRGAVAC